MLLLVISQALRWLLEGLGPTCILAVISLSAASASACLSANCRLCSPAFCFRSSTNALASVNLETPACQVEVNAESVQLRQIHLHLTSRRPTRRFIKDLSKVSGVIGRGLDSLRQHSEYSTRRPVKITYYTDIKAAQDSFKKKKIATLFVKSLNSD